MQSGDRTTILLEESQAVIQAAIEKATEIGQPMNVAVVDNGRDLKAFARMEDAWLGSINIAINKAFTSASFLMPTQDLAEMTQPGQPLYGLETTNEGRVVNFAGRNSSDARGGSCRGHRRERRYRRSGPGGRRSRRGCLLRALQHFSCQHFSLSANRKGPAADGLTPTDPFRMCSLTSWNRPMSKSEKLKC